MAVTSVTITSGPTVVGRSVTLSGTLARDGGGANNSVYFLCYDSTFTNSFTVRRLSDNSNLYDGSGAAGSGIAWTWTGTLPEGNYLGITAYQSGTDTALSSATASVGIIKLNPGLPGIWTPRRDARGLFVDRFRVAPGWKGGFGDNNFHRRSYHYGTPDGQIYWNAVENIARVGEYSGILAKPHFSPHGVGMDTPYGWEWPVSTLGSTVTSGGFSISAITYVSVFYIRNGSVYLNNAAASKYPPILGVASAIGANAGGYWSNVNGEQSIKFGQPTNYWGEVLSTISVDGIGNGLHCLVVVQCADTRTNGHRVYLDGKLVGAGTYPHTFLGAYTTLPSYYHGSISPSDLNIGTNLFQGSIARYYPSDEEARALSLDPYRAFFIDAPSQKSRLSRIISLGQSFQFSRPSADLLTGWTRVPASGTHVSAINEITSNQTDYLQATSTGLVDSFTMQPIDQPLSGGVDINLDIDASARPVTVELLNGATVVKSASVSTTGLTTISATAAELSGVSWPWTPTVRITSQ